MAINIYTAKYGAGEEEEEEEWKRVPGHFESPVGIVVHWVIKNANKTLIIFITVIHIFRECETLHSTTSWLKLRKFLDPCVSFVGTHIMNVVSGGKQPTVYVAESAISTGSAGGSNEGTNKSLAIAVGLGLVAVASACSILLLVGKNTLAALEDSSTYSGPPLSYYITKFNPTVTVQAEVSEASPLDN